jgi:hypothetical protein
MLRHRLWVMRVLLTAFAFPLAGCGETAGDAAPAGPPVVERDSAGLHIVENVTAAWTPGNAWQIDTVPSVTIGLDDGDPPYLFEHVVGAVRLSDGRIAVLDEGSSELRFYTPDGQYLSKIGRKGDGPGEFRRAEHIVRRGGDTLVIYDAGFGGISTVVGDHFVHHTRDNPDGVMKVIGYQNATERITPLADGSTIIHAMHRGEPPGEPGVVHRRMVGYFRIATDRKTADTLGWFEHGLPNLYLNMGGRPHYEVPLFAAHYDLAGNRDASTVYVTGGEDYEVRAISALGTTLIRRSDGLVVIPPDAKERARSQLRARKPSAWETRAQIDLLGEALPDPKYYPAISEIVVDSRNHLWARTPKGYDVFDPRGRWLGVLKVKGQAVDIGDDYVIVTTRDTMQIERVALYGLKRR